MADPIVLTSLDGGVAAVILNRPEVHNAFDEELIAALTGELKRLDADPAVRVVMLAAQGRSFCAGADLNWMRRSAGYSEQENLADAMSLAQLMHTLNTLSKPTVARVQGAAFGGGVGLIACCDIALAAKGAVFSFSEVRLGLIPAAISPYVVAAIGSRAARRYILTGERFTTEEAWRLGLIHAVVEADKLNEAVGRVVEALLQGGPQALAAAKELIAAVSSRPLDQALVKETARRIAAVRAGSEGREGVAAFLEKRKPAWVKGKD